MVISTVTLIPLQSREGDSNNSKVEDEDANGIAGARSDRGDDEDLLVQVVDTLVAVTIRC